MSALISFVDMLQPVLQFVHVCLFVGLICFILHSLTLHRDWVLVFLLAGCTISLVAVSIWLVFGLQTEWKIIMLPKEVARILYLIVRFLYPLEMVLWAAAIFMLAKRNAALTRNN